MLNNKTLLLILLAALSPWVQAADISNGSATFSAQELQDKIKGAWAAQTNRAAVIYDGLCRSYPEYIGLPEVRLA